MSCSLTVALRAGWVLAFVLLWGSGDAHAASGISFGGDKPDNQWRLNIRYCENGMRIHAVQTHLSTKALPFSLRLAHSSIPVRGSLPRIIAGGNGSSIAAHRKISGTLVVRFRRVQHMGTRVRIAIARLDRGLSHPAAADDTKRFGGKVGSCMVHG